MSELSFDAVVIGGGIIGCTTAYFMAKGGLNVALLERGRLAQGTSANSFAWINGRSKTTDETYHRFNAEGLAGYNALAQEFGEEAIGLNPCGELTLARAGDAAGRNELQGHFERLRAFGYPVTWISAADIRAMEPALVIGPDDEALLAPADMSLDAPKFTRFMAERFQALGGRLFEECAAHALEMDDEGRITGLETDAGRIETAKVMLAVGRDTADTLARLTGFEGFRSRFPLRRSPGLLMTTPELAPLRPVRRIIHWPDEQGLHVLPHFNGGLKLGAYDVDGLVAEEDTEAARRQGGEILLGRLREYVHGIPDDMTVDDCTLGVGVRPMPEDGQSIAGALPGAQGFYLVATHSGITLAPVVGRLMAEFIATRQTPEPLAPFRMERFSGFA